VLDLMIHDLDIILELVPSELASVEAIGMPVLSTVEDLADARIHFANGALADLRTSRVSFNAMRKIRFFQSDAYVSLDYNTRVVRVYRKKGPDFDAASIDPHTVKDPLKLVMDRYIAVEEHQMGAEADALTMELQSFVDACRGLHPPVVPGSHGYRAVSAARAIQQQIDAYIRRETQRKGLALPGQLGGRATPEQNH